MREGKYRAVRRRKGKKRHREKRAQEMVPARRRRARETGFVAVDGALVDPRYVKPGSPGRDKEGTHEN